MNVLLILSASAVESNFIRFLRRLHLLCLNEKLAGGANGTPNSFSNTAQPAFLLIFIIFYIDNLGTKSSTRKANEYIIKSSN